MLFMPANEIACNIEMWQVYPVQMCMHPYWCIHKPFVEEKLDNKGMNFYKILTSKCAPNHKKCSHCK